ncbi:MAG: glycosyltransferase [Halobacteriota archaeon]|uniref:glycosyltransferase n=1 Tax=Natronomonas sp. TaxID=2184060 RepID=UPI003976309E
MSRSDDLTVLLMDGDRYPENPYMSLSIGALRDLGVDVRTPELPLLFPLTRTAIRHGDADVMQLDWVYDYYTIGLTGNEQIDRVATMLRAATMLLDLIVVSLLPIAVVWTVHNERHHEEKYRRTERVVNELLFFVADAVSVKCHAAIEMLSSMYTFADSADFAVVPDGNFIPAYENEVSRETARAELSIPNDAFVCLFFGLVREYKGIPELIEAFVELDAPDTELWIVGNPHTDELQRELEALSFGIEDIETVFEFVPDNRVQYYMNAADVLALPYRNILNSGSAHLGLSYGTPVVAPAIGCLPETLPSGNFLYDPDDPDGLKTALDRAREHLDLESIARSNYEHAVEQDWETAAARLTEVYRLALDRS